MTGFAPPRRAFAHPLAAAIACGVVLQAFGAAAAPVEVHISGIRGDDGTGKGTALSPYRSLKRALEAVGDAEEAIVQVGAGVYSPGMTGDWFPLALGRHRALTIRGPAEGVALLDGAGQQALIEASLDWGAIHGGRSTLRVEGLRFEGGFTAISAVGPALAEFEVSLVGNSFIGQRYQAAEVVTGAGGRGRAVVRGNRVEGRSAFGIDLGTRERGTLEIAVEENRFEGGAPPPLPGFPGSEPPRFASAVYMDAGGAVRGHYDRNTFINVPTGILLAQSDAEADGGDFDVRISGCLIAGDPSPERNRLRHGFYLALRHYNRTRIRLLHNTVVNALGYAVYQEAPAHFAPGEADADLLVAGCIFWGGALTEFSAGSGGQALPHYYRVAGNILERSALEGNLRADPRFAAGFELSAGSLAVDAGPAVDPGPAPPDELAALGLGSDLLGACRTADGDGDGLYRMDLGALERPGHCLAEAGHFRRGDCARSDSHSLNIADPVAIFAYLFQGAERPSCLDACDVNDDRGVNLTDGIHLLTHLFLGGEKPPPPNDQPGMDPTADGLGTCLK